VARPDPCTHFADELDVVRPSHILAAFLELVDSDGLLICRSKVGLGQNSHTPAVRFQVLRVIVKAKARDYVNVEVI
jgi:hypothetical protein